MNIVMLQRVRDHIALNHQQCDMEEIIGRDNYSEGKCGTVGCIAGWAMALEEGAAPALELRRQAHRTYRSEGARILDLTTTEAELLFHANQWPEEYRTRYWKRDDVPGFDWVRWGEDSAYEGMVEREVREHNAPLVLELLDEVIKRQSIWWVSPD